MSKCQFTIKKYEWGKMMLLILVVKYHFFGRLSVCEDHRIDLQDGIAIFYQEYKNLLCALLAHMLKRAMSYCALLSRHFTTGSIISCTSTCFLQT